MRWTRGSIEWRLFGEVFRRLDSLNDKLDSNTRRLDTTLRAVDERLTTFAKVVGAREDRLNEIQSTHSSSWGLRLGAPVRLRSPVGLPHRHPEFFGYTQGSVA
jgi:hypothetical protein